MKYDAFFLFRIYDATTTAMLSTMLNPEIIAPNKYDICGILIIDKINADSGILRPLINVGVPIIG